MDVPVGCRQRSAAWHDAVDDAEALDERDQLGMAFEDERAAQRLRPGEIARRPDRVAEALLADDEEALSWAGLAAPALARHGRAA